MMTAKRIIAPPNTLREVILSPNIHAARTTVTTGSIVERVAAFVGPTRSRPARKVRIPRTVEIRARAITDTQPMEVVGKAAPLIPIRILYTIAAAMIIMVEDEIAVPCGIHLLPTIM